MYNMGKNADGHRNTANPEKLSLAETVKEAVL
jgi:hypothetical protein